MDTSANLTSGGASTVNGARQNSQIDIQAQMIGTLLAADLKNTSLLNHVVVDGDDNCVGEDQMMSKKAVLSQSQKTSNQVEAVQQT